MTKLVVKKGLLRDPEIGKMADDNIILPFKGRTIDKSLPIKVYRNLNKKGKCYSVVQKGLTVAHTTAICIRDCEFIVHETMRQRVVRTGRKEFHAYIKGYYTTSGMGTTAAWNDLPVKVTYCPFKNKTFMGQSASHTYPLKGAMMVICNHDGVKASYTH